MTNDIGIWLTLLFFKLFCTMKFYYTTSAGQDTIQSKSNLSLGRYRSSSIVPNNILGNLFPDISMLTVRNNVANNYIALILINEESRKAVGVNLWFKYNSGCSSLLRLAAVNLTADGEGTLCMEQVPNSHTKPLYAEFVEADGEVNRVNIGDIEAGAMVGIWLEREVQIATLKAEQNDIYSIDPSDPYRFIPKTLATEDSIEIGISWDN